MATNYADALEPITPTLSADHALLIDEIFGNETVDKTDKDPTSQHAYQLESTIYNDIFKHQPASKLSELPFGLTNVLALRAVNSKFGKTYLLLTDNDAVIWVNYSIRRYLNLMLDSFGEQKVCNKLKDEYFGYISLPRPDTIGVLSCFKSKFKPKTSTPQDSNGEDSLTMHSPAKLHCFRFSDKVFELMRDSQNFKTEL